MALNIVVPPMGESVTEATVAKWLVKTGDAVKMDQPLVELETDKVTLEVNATSAGVIGEIKAPQGSNVAVGAVLGILNEGAVAAAAPAAAPAPVVMHPAANQQAQQPSQQAVGAEPMMMPAARKMISEQGLNPYNVPATGKGGRITKEDVVNVQSGAVAIGGMNAPKPAATPRPVATGPRPRAAQEERVRMTRLRQRIAERLKDAQNTAAMLTTFNEIDMTNVMALRNTHKDVFEKKHGVKLGFMSFFVKACITALKELPAVNAEIEGDELVYKNYYDIGVAVGTPNGLVVPVVRDADMMSFAAIEKKIGDLGKKAKDGKLAMEDLAGGTFTITNGGIYGSLMSTPILNPPQSGILGMHSIKERPVALNGEVKIRPMMYVALSYDHRIIDGREAVTFLVRVKECLEDPQRLLLEM